MWIEIISLDKINDVSISRTPRGVCGLKSLASPPNPFRLSSYPARGMWIEISTGICLISPYLSYPARGMWIEIA